MWNYAPGGEHLHAGCVWGQPKASMPAAGPLAQALVPAPRLVTPGFGIKTLLGVAPNLNFRLLCSWTDCSPCSCVLFCFCYLYFILLHYLFRPITTLSRTC